MLSVAHVKAAFDFIAAHGLVAEDLSQKRAYGSSGQKGVWKFGDGMWRRTDAEGVKRWERVKTEGSDEVKSEPATEADAPAASSSSSVVAIEDD